MGAGYLPDPETFMRTTPTLIANVQGAKVWSRVGYKFPRWRFDFASLIPRKGQIWIDTTRRDRPIVKRLHRDGWHVVKGRKALRILRRAGL